MRVAMLWLLSCTVVGAVEAQSAAKPPGFIDFATFSAEPVDPMWSQGMEARILDELAVTTGLALLGLQVECRTTLCRIQSTIWVSKHTDTRPDALFWRLVDRVAALGLSWQQNSTSTVQGSTQTSVAYLRRAGTATTVDGTSGVVEDFVSATIVDVHRRHVSAQDNTEADIDQEVVIREQE